MINGASRLTLQLLFLGLCACTSGGSGPGGLAVRAGVVTVHDFGPVTVACRAESLCPQYRVPFILDVARRGDDWIVLYSWDVPVDPTFGVFHTATSYFVSRDGGATWSEPALTGGSYGTRIVTSIGASPPAFPVSLAVLGGEFYQVVPYEEELGTGIWTRLQLWHIDLDAGRVTQTGTIIWPWGFEDGETLVFYDFHGASPSMPTYFMRIDPATGSIAEERFENYVNLPMHGVGTPPIWRSIGRRGLGLALGAHALDSYLPSTPLRHCYLVARPPDPLHPTEGCMLEADWPVSDEAAPSVTTFATRSLNGFAGVLWTDGTGAAEQTRGLELFGSPDVATPTTYDLGPGRLLFPITDGAAGGHAFGGIDRPRFGEFVALTEEIEDGSRRTRLSRFTSARTFEEATLPTRPCADGVACGFRPETVRGARLDSVLQWMTPVGRDDFRMFYVVDVATETENRLVMLTSVEHLDRGPASGASPLERACVLEAACTEGRVSIDTCVWSWLNPVESNQAAFDRFVAARTCAEVAAADPGAFPQSGSCAGAPGECRGALGLSCSGGSVLSVAADCGRTGSTCVPDGAGWFDCAPPGFDCASSGHTCDAEGRAIFCEALGVLDCAAAGLECSPDRGASCILRTTACTGGAMRICDGDRVVDCQEAGIGIVAHDCGRLPGLSCVASGGTAACGDGSGSCDAFFSDVCDSSRLTFCLDTTLRQLDCAELGMTCGPSGASGAGCIARELPDAGVPADAGPPACGDAALMGAPVPEVGVPTYPTPMGGPITPGTYVLTSYEIWSAAVQPYTHQETMVFGADGTLSILSAHSVAGTMSTSGTYATLDVNLSYMPSCPGPASLTWRYSVTPSGLVIMDGSQIRTYERR